MGLNENLEKKSAEQQFKKVKLNLNDQKIIKILLQDYSHKAPDRWATKKRLGEKLNPKDPIAGIKTVEKHLKTLGKKLEKLGVELKEDYSDIFEEKVYSLDIKELKGILQYLPIFNQPKQDETLLLISEPGFGQVLHDKRSDKGLHYFLKHNGFLSEIDAVLILGGVPWVPLKSNKRTTQWLKLLGKKIKDTQFPDEEQPPEIDDPEYFQKHIKNKITTLTEAIESGAKSLETILGKNFGGEVHYFFSQQDRKNHEDRAELLTANYEVHKKKKDKLEEKINKLEEEVEFKEDKYKALVNAYEIIKELQQQVKKIKDSKKIKLKIKNYVKAKKESLDKILGDSYEVYQKILVKIEKIKNTQELGNFVKSLSKEKDETKIKLEKSKSELRDALNENTNLEKMLKSFNVYKALGHLPAEPYKDSEHHRQAMKEYKQELANLWKKWNGSTTNIHSEARKDLEIKGYLHRIEPQINQDSDNVGVDTLKRQMVYLRNSIKKHEIIPDDYISGYDAGGFRVMPQMKYREAIEEFNYHDEREVVTHFKLPTMQSEDWLEYCLRNKLRSPWDVKRKRKGNYASGIVLRKRTKEGLNEVIFVSTKNLINLGINAEKYEKIEEELKSTKRESKKELLEKKLQDLKNSFKIRPNYGEGVEREIDIALIGDVHLGSENYLGRPTNYEMLKAVIKYTLERRIPDVLITGELLHGNHNTESFKSDKRDVGLLPSEIDKLGKLIAEDETITDKEKITLLKYFSLITRLTQPITSSSKQLLEIIDGGLVEFGEKIIDNKGIVAIVSGNHYNHSNKQSHDEAEVLAAGFDRKYRKTGRLKILDGTAERDGRGQFSLDLLRTKKAKEKEISYGKVYAAHSYKGATDPIMGIMNTVKKMKLETGIVSGGHVHQTGAGFADGKKFVINPGLQTVNKYVGVLGQIGGFRGAMNLEISRNPVLNDYFKVVWASQEYLEEKYLQVEKKAHKKIVEEYLPKVRIEK